MESQVTPAEIARAKKLHSTLLFDFIVVHVFLFVIALGFIKSSLIPLYLMPVISFALLGNVLFKAKRAVTRETSHFVLSHILLAAQRARLFLLLFVVTGTLTAGLLFGGVQLGISKVAGYALAFGIGQLPFMVVLLVLVVLEFDAEHQCSSGKVPAAALALAHKTKKV